MRKNVFGRQFSRDTDQRKALLKGLMSSLVLDERIKTTEAKAKAIKASADKLVSKAKKDVFLARRLLAKELNPQAIEKMIRDVAPRFTNRAGGYTRIIKLGNRFSDNAPVVVMEWVESKKAIVSKEQKTQPAKKTEKVEATVSTQKTKKVPAKKKTAIVKKGKKNE